MIRLHGYWRSTASYRVRIALGLKGISFTQVSHDLRKGEQSAREYLALNPQGLVPALETEDGVLGQSPAILEWIEEIYPEPPLLPSSPAGRAQVRAIAATICCDIHPLNNLRIITSLRNDLSASEEQVSQWIARWISSGFAAIEMQIAEHGGEFTVGDLPTIADCCLVPQIYSAERFGVDLDRFTLIQQVAGNCAQLTAFKEAHPDVQQDAPLMPGT